MEVLRVSLEKAEDEFVAAVEDSMNKMKFVLEGKIAVGSCHVPSFSPSCSPSFSFSYILSPFSFLTHELLSDQGPLKYITAMVQAQLNFHKVAVEALAELQPELEEIGILPH